MVRFRPFAAFFFACLLLATALPVVPFVFAETSSQEDADPNQDSLKEEINVIQDQVRAKEQSVKVFDETIERYRKRIQQQVTTLSTLRDHVELLDTKIEQLETRKKRAKAEHERLTLTLEQLAKTIEHTERTLTLRRALLEHTLSELAFHDEASPFVAALARGSLSAYVAEREEWRALESELTRLTEDVKQSKALLDTKQAETLKAKKAQEKELKQLIEAQDELDEERGAKMSLIGETQNREEEYRRLVANIRQEQQSEADALSALRERLQDKLDSADEVLARGDILLQWPVVAKRGISAQFHDKTYPFRHLFEHPGTDIPVSVGTPIRAAAGGYVAWSRRGKQYGNYMMLIHPSGIATVYAHLSGFVAQADTYVERGEVIGYSGGKPGDPGAGLSTGPHLHFEVRQNGIPVNPTLFLPEL